MSRKEIIEFYANDSDSLAGDNNETTEEMTLAESSENLRSALNDAAGTADAVNMFFSTRAALLMSPARKKSHAKSTRMKVTITRIVLTNAPWATSGFPVKAFVIFLLRGLKSAPITW